MADTNEIAISHLQRRKIEGRVLIPFVDVLREKLGESAAYDLIDETIRRLAAKDGASWAASLGQSTASLRRLAEEIWAAGDGMAVELVGESEDHLDFNVTRCRYAEFYREQGLSELGIHIHCNRDHAMVAGFNSELELCRSQTIMAGASHCDFRYRKRP